MHASNKFRKYTVILDYNDPTPGFRDSEWLQMLKVGDVVEIYSYGLGMARYRGWVDYIEYVSRVRRVLWVVLATQSHSATLIARQPAVSRDDE